MSDINNDNNNLDIKRINKSLEEGDRGFLLSFPKPPNGSVPPRDLYTFNFDVPEKGRLPQEPESTVIFTPSVINNPEKSFFIGSSVDTNVNVGLSIRSIHKAETQTLIRLQIKDIYNTILYTDYILVICSPIKVVRLSAELISRLFGVADSFGPNGGRVLRINTSEDSSINLLSQLFTRMKVEGPGIPANETIVIGSFVSDNRTDIELLPFFETDRDFDVSTRYRGIYSFTNVFSCPSPEDLKEISFNERYIILEQNNNWSYFFRQKLVVQFIPNKNTEDWENIAIFLNIKNFEALVSDSQASRLPESVFINASGRVLNDSTCLNLI